MYKVKFQNPMTNLVVSKWISLKDIADLQQIRSDKRHLLCKMFLVALSNEQKLVRQGFDITFCHLMETVILVPLRIIYKELQYTSLQKHLDMKW